MNPLTITLLQTSAGVQVRENLNRIEHRLGDASPADVVVLPEVFQVRGAHEDYVSKAESLRGPTIERLSRIASVYHCWIVAGSMMESDGDAIYNTCVVLDRRGKIRATYRKIHLFEAHLDTGETIREADTYSAGSDPGLVEIEGWVCGLSICYDLRFPELYRHYSKRGAHLLFVPANFTQRTGKDHWEILLRARAIENQCFVVAPNQCGVNCHTRIASYGHSMAIDPWGKVLAEADDRETVLTVLLDPERMKETRARISVLEHRKL